MNKTDFIWILESALFSFDDVSEEKMVNQYGINLKFVKAGIKLSSYMKLKELTENEDP